MPIRRGVVLAFLAVGTVVGFGSGFSRMHHWREHRRTWEAPAAQAVPPPAPAAAPPAPVVAPVVVPIYISPPPAAH